MITNPSEFLGGLVEHIDKFATSHSAEDLALIHEGASMALDYMALQTIRANPTGDHSDTVAMSECFMQHVELFYKNPEELAVE